MTRWWSVSLLSCCVLAVHVTTTVAAHNPLLKLCYDGCQLNPNFGNDCLENGKADNFGHHDMFSCSHGCLMRHDGEPKDACKSHCNRRPNSGNNCSAEVAGRTYELCGSCNNGTSHLPKPEIEECEYGCQVYDVGSSTITTATSTTAATTTATITTTAATSTATTTTAAAQYNYEGCFDDAADDIFPNNGPQDMPPEKCMEHCEMQGKPFFAYASDDDGYYGYASDDDGYYGYASDDDGYYGEWCTCGDRLPTSKKNGCQKCTSNNVPFDCGGTDYQTLSVYSITDFRAKFQYEGCFVFDSSTGNFPDNGPEDKTPWDCMNHCKENGKAFFGYTDPLSSGGLLGGIVDGFACLLGNCPTKVGKCRCGDGLPKREEEGSKCETCYHNDETFKCGAQPSDGFLLSVYSIIPDTPITIVTTSTTATTTTTTSTTTTTTSTTITTTPATTTTVAALGAATKSTSTKYTPQPYILAANLSNVCPQGYREITRAEAAECEMAASDPNIDATWYPGFDPNNDKNDGVLVPTGCYKNTNNGNAHINSFSGAPFTAIAHSDAFHHSRKICKASSTTTAILSSTSTGTATTTTHPLDGDKTEASNQKVPVSPSPPTTPTPSPPSPNSNTSIKINVDINGTSAAAEQYNLSSKDASSTSDDGDPHGLTSGAAAGIAVAAVVAAALLGIAVYFNRKNANDNAEYNNKPPTAHHRNNPVFNSDTLDGVLPPGAFVATGALAAATPVIAAESNYSTPSIPTSAEMVDAARRASAHGGRSGVYAVPFDNGSSTTAATTTSTSAPSDDVAYDGVVYVATTGAGVGASGNTVYATPADGSLSVYSVVSKGPQAVAGSNNHYDMSAPRAPRLQASSTADSNNHYDMSAPRAPRLRASSTVDSNNHYDMSAPRAPRLRASSTASSNNRSNASAPRAPPLRASSSSSSSSGGVRGGRSVYRGFQDAGQPVPARGGAGKTRQLSTYAGFDEDEDV